ncbi:MAG: hypothetical protein H7101_07115 [Deinococcales bacterium]|nr:hypothetical protein [Chitinophagaceae bacterium]
MLQKVTQKMFVQLSTYFDEERFSQMSRSEKIQELNRPKGNIFFQVSSLNDAVKLCNQFINRFNLGGSNWSGGMVINENFDFIATISYNGRVWDNKDWKIAKEVKIC